MTIIANKYRIINELGGGSYGQVYLVEHVDLSVKYALKVLDNKFSEDERFIERFKREAEILLRFSHPGSVQLRDFGRTSDGRYYMAMDFIAGRQLTKLIEEKKLFTPEEAQPLIEQLLSVLAAAHDFGIIHRDIKPENIMIIEESGKRDLKILDFGIAKIKEEAISNRSTLEGVSIGTPHYMSPEQAAGEQHLDHRVDIYSAGIVIYELLIGKVPFDGTTVVQTLLMHITKLPPPFAQELNISSELEAAVMRALKKDRNQRPQSANIFLQEILSTFKKQGKNGLEERNSTMDKKEDLQDTKIPCDGKKKTKVLCLDDDAMVLNILKHILEREGYDVVTANDCSAIHQHLFGDNKATLFVSDVEMPGLPGTKICRMLKDSFKELQILLFSNLSERELEKAAKTCRADGYICKQTPPPEWIKKIREVVPPIA